MNKEMLEKRINELQSQKDMSIANANACAGGIEDCKYWLHVLDEEEKKLNSDNQVCQ